MNKCINCGKPARNKFCSRACFAKYRQNYRTCIVCGKKFPVPKANSKYCCSDECSSLHRKQMHESGIYDHVTEKMLKAKEKHAQEYQGELHWNAKNWVIQSPNGKVYECRNLHDFIRQNPDLFDGTLKQAFDGFIKMKQTAQGKRKKCKSYQWKGWRLLQWGE